MFVPKTFERDPVFFYNRTMDCQLKIRDEKGRVLIKLRGDRLLVARFKGMNETTKKIVIDFYTEFTGEEQSKIKDFLDYKNEEMEFCS